MNGETYFLDTNAIISLLNGSPTLLSLLNSASWVGISVISKLEFLSFPGITEEDILLFDNFTSKIEILSLDDKNEDLIKRVIKVQSLYF